MRGIVLQLLTVALILLVIGVTACGGASSRPAPNLPAPQVNLPGRPAPQLGVAMPQLMSETFDIAQADKGASAAYRIFFRDMVNESSTGRWTPQNNSGKKQWMLSNTFFSAPKAWVVGGQYWNFENDELFSVPFDIPDATDGLALTFYARWNVLAGDMATVYFYDGVNWQQVINWEGSANPSYPGWDKYYFQLPANSSGSTQSCSLDFMLTSDGAGTSFGFGVDSVAVYQTQLGTPTGLTASDGGLPGEVVLNWNHNNTGNLEPAGYDIYRAGDVGGSPGPYLYLSSVLYPTDAANDLTGNGQTYWYKVVATKPGWPDSLDSNEDSGFGDGSWTIVNVTNDSEADGSNSSLAIIGGRPAVTWRRSTGGNDGVCYSVSLSADGSNSADWSAPVFVDTGNTGLRGTSLAEVVGRPAVTYHDIGSGELLYARAADSNGSDWNGPGSTGFILDSGGGTNDVGKESTLRVTSDGYPCVVYTDTTAQDIKFAISTQQDGTDQLNWDSWVLYNGTSVQHPWMEIVQGNPAVAFSEPTGAGQVSYWRASDPSPIQSDWDGSDYAIAVSGWFATYPALFVCNGNPGVAYLDGNSDLRFQRCSTAEGDLDLDWSNGSNAFVGGAPNNYDFCRANFLLNRPRIAYSDVVDEDVFVTTASNVNGDAMATWDAVLVDGAASRRGEPSQIIAVDGGMAFTYRNLDDDDLMYALYK